MGEHLDQFLAFAFDGKIEEDIMTFCSLCGYFIGQLGTLLHERLDHVVVSIFGRYLQGSLFILVKIHVTIFKDLFVKQVADDHVISILSCEVKKIYVGESGIVW